MLSRIIDAWRSVDRSDVAGRLGPLLAHLVLLFLVVGYTTNVDAVNNGRISVVRVAFKPANSTDTRMIFPTTTEDVMEVRLTSFAVFHECVSIVAILYRWYAGLEIGSKKALEYCVSGTALYLAWAIVSGVRTIDSIFLLAIVFVTTIYWGIVAESKAHLKTDYTAMSPAGDVRLWRVLYWSSCVGFLVGILWVFFAFYQYPTTPPFFVYFIYYGVFVGSICIPVVRNLWDQTTTKGQIIDEYFTLVNKAVLVIGITVAL